MTALGRLSTCAVCRGTIRLTADGWEHVAGARGHLAEPDDGAVSGPAEGG